VTALIPVTLADRLDSVKYVVGDDDDSFPAPKEGGKRLSAALDLAPLAQTQHRTLGQRPFDTGLKTSEWSNYPSGQRGMTSPLPGQTSLDAQDPNGLAGRKPSPTGMADSIASLPALPSKSVPGTPFGFGGIGGGPRTRTPNAQDGLNQSQRGYSNPDLARSFGKSGGFSQLDNGAPRVCPEYLVLGLDSADLQPYNADPMYQMYGPNSAPLPPSAAVAAAFNPNAFDPYGFDEDAYGSGSVYPGGAVGLKNKRAEADRECKSCS
jgi:hypothetical protein